MNQYPIKSISFENYKAFKSRQKLELKSLTLLFGYNNTWKIRVAHFIDIEIMNFYVNNNYEDFVRHREALMFEWEKENFITPAAKIAGISDLIMFSSE